MARILYDECDGCGWVGKETSRVKISIQHQPTYDVCPECGCSAFTRYVRSDANTPESTNTSIYEH